MGPNDLGSIADVLCIVNERIGGNRPFGIRDFLQEFDLSVNSEIAANIVAHVCAVKGFVLDDLITILLDPIHGFSKSQQIAISRLVVHDMITMRLSVELAPFYRLGVEADQLQLKHEMDYYFLGQFVENTQVELVERVAHGAFTVVYRGEFNGKSIAVRVPRSDETMGNLFKRIAKDECKLRESFSIDGIPKQYRWKMTKNGPISFGQFLDGGTLAQLSQYSNLDPNVCLNIMREVAKIVDNLHTKGIRHGDIKPSNIFVSKCNTVFLLDFNAADRVRPKGNSMSRSPFRHLENRHVAGTSQFMSPEVRTSRRIADIKADIFSLGVTLYEIFARRQFAPTENATSTFMDLVEKGQDYEPQFDLGVPKPIRSIVKIATSMKSEERFETAIDFADACTRAIENPDAEFHAHLPLLQAWRLGKLLSSRLVMPAVHLPRCSNEEVFRSHAYFWISEIEKFLKHLSVVVCLDELRSQFLNNEEGTCVSSEGDKLSEPYCRNPRLQLKVRIFFDVQERVNSKIYEALLKRNVRTASVYCFSYLFNSTCPCIPNAFVDSFLENVKFPDALAQRIREFSSPPKTFTEAQVVVPRMFISRSIEEWLERTRDGRFECRNECVERDGGGYQIRRRLDKGPWYVEN